jgi:protein-L-isoaspartate(D-aspartate) O-methyltransferase
MLLPFSILLLFRLLLYPVQEDAYKDQRHTMVKRQIEARGVQDKAVLKAMRTVKRHLFVPEEIASEAYSDRALPLGYGQTISQPYIVAYMTEMLRPTSQMKVLEVGTGNGYQAAVLAEIVKEVYTIEIVPELGESAKERLKRLGYDNVQVKVGDGYKGWEEHAPFDAIIVTAAPENVPPPLLAQLKEGGRMVIPVGPAYSAQNLMLLEKKDKKVVSRKLIPVIFVPFTRDEKN